jgi:hypothetical protein
MNTKSIRQGDFMAAKTSVPLAVKRCHDLLLWIRFIIMDNSAN